MRRKITSGGALEAIVGYSRAVVVGDWCFVAGTTGFDPVTKSTPPDIRDQIENAFNTVGKALAEADFAFEDVVRVTYYVTIPGIHDEIAPLFGARFGEIRPAATYVEVAGLAYPEMKFEVEITALKG
ncbi:RidA family protein [Erythrobacter dokdonensis]|uniref:Putative translation initiation inhibitor, yjgF family / putative Endoribonuclease L-PSP n=1 Tax=Erythrobacter dokdonensis DSW-74 TaxID=1300349 RepID=A0A1A7BNC4_9SPHN|nr:RidA family protein [Erythrobacter dokdonensis]OBV12660.1 putative translation initiation inhibitor, yjgF family / putative Endoribonuclease L-PSP [Erythrobacter dokdonensis DSW-74]